MLQRKTGQTGIVYYSSALLDGAGVPHAFSTRLGGISTGVFKSMNLGNPSGVETQDEWEKIHENYRRLQHAAGLRGSERCWVHQVHGGDVVLVRAGHEFKSGARADALVGDDPQRVLGVRVADCVPVLLASEDGKVVAAIHAGWRGVVAQIVTNALRELRRLTEAPVLAAIGPCISRCAFEVGGEVLKQFEQLLGPDAPIEHNSDQKGHVDLRRAIEMQLASAGVASERIDTTDCCTFRDADEFFSHRRERGVTGRMAALIAPRGA